MIYRAFPSFPCTFFLRSLLFWNSHRYSSAPKAFFASVIPNIRSGLMSAFILAFINSFNDVCIGVFVSNPGTMTLPTAMMSYVQGRIDPTIAAASVILMLMTIAIMVLAEKLLGVKLQTN